MTKEEEKWKPGVSDEADSLNLRLFLLAVSRTLLKSAEWRGE